MFSFSPKTIKQLKSLSPASVRVIRAVIHMLEQGQRQEVEAFMKALEAVK